MKPSIGWLLTTLLSLVICSTAASLAQETPQREITQIAGDLYRFQNDFHYSVFLVTPEGIIATDPVNSEAAQWLKDELMSRFNQSVRYLIYSHDHADHISGGEVFAEDGAIVIAHDNAKADIIGEQHPTAVPDVTFADTLTLELGGKTVELTYFGRNHSDNSIVMRFPEERALFAVDFIPVRSMPFINLPDFYVPDWIDSLRAVEQVDFDILVPGHGELGGKADVTAMREYAEDLYAAVLEQVRAGRTLEEAQSLVELDEYSDWAMYEEWLPLNIEGMYTRLSLQRADPPVP